MKLLDVRIDTVTKDEALERAASFLSDEQQHTIFTPNPEMLVKAASDSYFKEVLNGASLSLCDGKGIQLFAPEKVTRISGVDFMLELCRIAEERGSSIFLLGSGSEAVVAKVKENLLKQFPKLKIVGALPGPEIAERQNRIEIKNNVVVIDIMRREQPSIIFVAFGMGKQEKWIHENLAQLPSVKIAMGVGGAFDFISGIVPRAPLLLRKLGLEWAYRLVRQPQRIGRIWNATVKFVYYVLRYRNMKFIEFKIVLLSALIVFFAVAGFIYYTLQNY